MITAEGGHSQPAEGDLHPRAEGDPLPPAEGDPLARAEGDLLARAEGDLLARGPGIVGLRVPGTLAYRHLAIRLVSTACRAALGGEHVDEDETFTHEVVSAFGEAFNNIAIHGYRGVAPGVIRVEVGWDDERLEIVVMDMGRTFDPDTVSPPDLDAMQESGMGVFIMRSCMDEVHYQPGPPNVLRLVKARRPAKALGEKDADEGEAVVEQSAWRMKVIPEHWRLDPEDDLEAALAAAGGRTAEASRRR